VDIALSPRRGHWGLFAWSRYGLIAEAQFLVTAVMFRLAARAGGIFTRSRMSYVQNRDVLANPNHEQVDLKAGLIDVTPSDSVRTCGKTRGR
jgi:hypothetical protein